MRKYTVEPSEAGIVHAPFDPRRHEPLVADTWDEGAAAAAIEAIAGEALRAQRGGLWERHPLDGDAPDEAKSLYYGSAGVLWALAHLARCGAIRHDPRVGEWARALPSLHACAPDEGLPPASYFVGASGVLLLGLREGAGESTGDTLLALVEGHVEHPTRETFLGSAGTAIAAALAHEATGDERFRNAYLRSARALVAAWERHPADRHDLWTQDLYGAKRRLLGASHGFAGNVFALLRGSALLPEADRAALPRRAAAALLDTAATEDGLANWPIAAGGSPALVQWCHGAPGMVTSFARAPALPDLDACLLRAGELVWRAGPLRKGPSLCHGTAGNGEAFLALFARTGDRLWLDRARRFAMHACAQVEAARRRYGRGRHTLWTGDLGVAVFLWQCQTGTAGMPSLDF
jgi:hypothetical protein